MKRGIQFSMLIVALVVFAGSDAFAWKPKIPGTGKDKSSNEAVSKEDALMQQDKLVKKYMASSLKITDAQILLAKAFGLKEQVEKLEAQKENLERGNVMSVDEIKKQRKVSEEAEAEINAKVDEGTELSDEGKKHYKKALKPFFEGVLLKKDIVVIAQTCLDNAKTVIEKASITEKVKLKKNFDTTLFLAPKIAPDLSSMATTGSKFITYAKKNKVKVPKNSTDALGDL